MLELLSEPSVTSMHQKIFDILLSFQDPNLLSQLDADDLAALSELSSAELAPPPSDEAVFGEKMDALKREYEADKER